MTNANRTRLVSIGIGIVAVCMFGYVVVNGGHASDSNEIILQTATLATLPPHEHKDGDAVSDTGHHQYLVSEVYTVSRDIWIRSLSFDLVNAPDTSVHHVSLLDFDRPHQTCASLPFSQLFILAQDVMHQATTTFPSGTGMFLHKGEHVQLSLMIHNPEPPLGPGDTYHNVYARLKFELIPYGETAHLKAIHFHLAHLDDAPCVIKEADQSDAYVFAIPPHTKGYAFSGHDQKDDPSRFTFKKASTIVFIGAHLHGWQGGKELFVRKNTQPFLTFETKPSVDVPYRYDTPYYPTSLTMRAGDTLSLRAVYDNPHALPTRGAMGDVGFYYYENE